MKTIISFISLLLIISSCRQSEIKNENAGPVINDSIMKHLQTAKVTLADMDGFVKLNGKIQANDSKQSKVFSLVSGRLEKINVELGDKVSEGQVLAILRSSEVAGISNDLSSAASNVEMAKKAMETSKELYDGHLATAQDYLNAKITYNKAVSELNRASQVAAISGGNSSTYTIKAPISGYIIEKNVSNHSEVRADNNTDMFAIADLSTVWIIANVYEADMNQIHEGDPVKVNTLAKPDKDYEGKIDKIYNVLDPSTRTMKVRISMNNSENELKPEMFASIRVNGRTGNKALAIPAQSIVMDNSKNYVVVKKDNQLSVKEIELIKRVDNKAYITGLTEGDEVVTNSQVFLYQSLNEH